MEQLTILVTCTDRKLLTPARQLSVRDLAPGSVNQRCASWVRRVSTADTESVELAKLYKGDTWLQSTRLVEDARAKSHVCPLVASAGLGLQEMRAKQPSYAATFAQGHPDTVSPASQSEFWWKGLQAIPGCKSLEDLQGRVLAVLSSSYARAMDSELRALAQRSDAELLLIGGWQDIPSASRIPADKALRKELGGAAGSLLPRMARQWLSFWEGAELSAPQTWSKWHEWSASVRHEETYQREPLTDAEVLRFIFTLRSQQPAVSATKALRALRDAGYACEQKRFGALFASAREAA